ncbi:MAG: DEAD/DEAH box helicase [Candidatus Saccharimonadales bacterium]
MNNYSKRPSGQGTPRPRNNFRPKRRTTPEDKLFATLNAVNGTSGSSASRTDSGSRPSARRFGNGRPVGGNTQGGRRSTAGGKKARGQYIHPSKFVNKAVVARDETPYVPAHQFVDFPLNHRLQDNIASKGYVTPSAIQDQTIPSILEGRDVLGLANTGTGKTAAFLIPAIQKLMGNPAYLSVLIITPTRELAAQIDDEFKAFARDLRLYSAVVVGGMSIHRQIQSIRRRPHVVIGTPGRLKDLLQQNVLRLDAVDILVLDEADRMCDMGFLPDIKRIISLCPPARQNLFFSATMTPTIHSLISEMMHDPVTVSVVKGETSDHVEQDVIAATDKAHKIELLTDMLSNEAFERVLVFSETKYGAQRLSDTLNKSGFASEAIHGNKSQPQRQRALDAFKSGRAKVLVATDVAARGLDIPNVSHVINFDQPHTYDDYVHRIGRTGRAGAHGKAYTFVEQK